MTSDAVWQVLVAAGLVGAGVLAGGWIVGVGAPVLADAGVDGAPRRTMLGALRVLLILLGILAGLSWLGIDVRIAGALLIVLALAAGLALRPTVADLANGLVLRSLDTLRVGERVRIGTVEGVVAELGALAMVLDAPDGTRVTVAHRHVLRSPVENLSRAGRHRLAIEVPLPWSADVAAATAAVLEAIGAEPSVLADPPPSVGVARLAPRIVALVAHAWVEDPDGAPQIRAAVVRGLRAAGVTVDRA